MYLNNIIERLNNHMIHRKKIAALSNYACSSEKFNDFEIIEYFKALAEFDFLSCKDAAILDEMLAKYSINYLDWCCKNLWVKAQIIRQEQKRFELFLTSKRYVKNYKIVPTMQPKGKMVQMRLF